MTTEKEFKAIQLGETTIVEKPTEKDIIEELKRDIERSPTDFRLGKLEGYELGIQSQKQKIIEEIGKITKNANETHLCIDKKCSCYDKKIENQNAFVIYKSDMKELLKSINSQETKLDNNNRLTTNNSVAKLRTNSSPDKTLGEKDGN